MIPEKARFELPPQTGNCVEFSPDPTKVPESSSIIAVLIGLLKNGQTTDHLLASAQVREAAAAGGSTAGELLPAVQKSRVLLPAVR